MKTFLAFALLAFVGIAHAQVTCQTYGNTTNCNGSLGSNVAAQPFVNFGAEQARQSLMDEQAALAQQQAEYLRQQNELMRQQIAAQQAQQAAQQQAQQAQQAAQGQAQELEHQRREACARHPEALTWDGSRCIVKQSTSMPRAALQEQYEACVRILLVAGCKALKKRLDEEPKS